MGLLIRSLNLKILKHQLHLAECHRISDKHWIVFQVVHQMTFQLLNAYIRGHYSMFTLVMKYS